MYIHYIYRCIYIYIYIYIHYTYIYIRKRESFWQHKIHTFQPNGLNEYEAALF